MAEPRSTASHMDFQYDNGTGRVDQHGAFAQSIRNIEAQQAQTWHGQTDNINKKRPFSAYNSPQKSSTSFGELRNPSGSTLFTKPSQSDLNNPFTTPRTSREAEIPSSGPETSPENNADSEATPDYSAKNIFNKGVAPLKLFSGVRDRTDGQHSPLAKTASGRGDMRGHAGAITKRRRKNPDRERQIIRKKVSARFDESSSSEPGSPGYFDQPKQSHQEKQGPLSTFFHFLDTHPRLPIILSWYAQLLFNVSLSAFFLYLLYSFYSTIRGDVDKKASEARAEAITAIAACAKQFADNGCDSTSLVPALAIPCAEWQRCMERDADIVSRGKLSASAFAEIFNDFVEPISWKALAFFVVVVISVFGVGNSAFAVFRSRQLQNSAYVGGAGGGWVPPTPQHEGQWGTAPAWDYQGSPGKRLMSPGRPAIEPYK